MIYSSEEGRSGGRSRCRGRRVNDEAEGRSRATDHPAELQELIPGQLLDWRRRSRSWCRGRRVNDEAEGRSRATDHPAELQELNTRAIDGLAEKEVE
jgi:hypothetical protein